MIEKLMWIMGTGILFVAWAILFGETLKNIRDMGKI